MKFHRNVSPSGWHFRATWRGSRPPPPPAVSLASGMFPRRGHKKWNVSPSRLHFVKMFPRRGEMRKCFPVGAMAQLCRSSASPPRRGNILQMFPRRGYVLCMLCTMYALTALLVDWYNLLIHYRGSRPISRVFTLGARCWGHTFF